MQALHFDDPAFVARYVEGPGRFVPGYQIMQRMTAQRLAEVVGAAAHILVLGAGGGLELQAFVGLQPGWSYTGLDPSRPMLDQARRVMEATGAADRVQWVEGYIPDAPPGPFDAATCLLTLHFVADGGPKIEALRAVRGRLKPGAPFAVVDLCLDKAAPDYEARLDRYACFALESGADPQDVAATRQRLIDVLQTVGPEREAALFAEAGFRDPDLYYAGHAWRGWIMTA